jgi:hypothetical protein
VHVSRRVDAGHDEDNPVKTDPEVPFRPRSVRIGTQPGIMKKWSNAGLWTTILGISAALSFAQMNVAEISAGATDPAGDVIQGAAVIRGLGLTNEEVAPKSERRYQSDFTTACPPAGSSRLSLQHSYIRSDHPLVRSLLRSLETK